MPSNSARKDQRRSDAQSNRRSTNSEKAAMYQLAAVLEAMDIRDGYVRADVQNGQLISDFLRQADDCASILKVHMTSRSYREQFTANYRTILPSHKRHYLPDILMASMSQAQEGGYVCVNGDLHPLTNECRNLAAALRSALLLLASDFTRFAANRYLPHLPASVRIGRPHLQGALRAFDEAWTGFEKEYVAALIEIEAKSRAPLIEAVNAEKLIGTSCDSKDDHNFQQFFSCLSNLIAKVNLRQRLTDDSLDCAVLLAGSLMMQEHRNGVTDISARSVLNSFMAARAYLRTIEARLEHIHPDLHMNSGLAAVLNALKRNCKLFDEWGQPGSANCALNSVVAVAKNAMVKMSRFKDMCEECDPELFLVLPRILLLCCLRDLAAFQDILKKFLLNHVCASEDVSKGEKQEHRRTSPAQSGKLEVLAENLSSTMQLLQGAVVNQNMQDLSSQEDFAFDMLIQRAILGVSEDKQTLYQCEPESQGAVSSAVNAFMLELEGWSHELQRNCPEAWNDFTALFLSCIGDGLPPGNAEDTQI